MLAQKEQVDDASAVETVTVQLAGTALETVREQARKRGISLNEYVRRAISTEAYINKQVSRGNSVVVEDRYHRPLKKLDKR